jgi:hypothetical protein
MTLEERIKIYNEMFKCGLKNKPKASLAMIVHNYIIDVSAALTKPNWSKEDIDKFFKEKEVTDNSSE